MTYDHKDMSRLSYSGAKLLLEPGGPARYLHTMTSPQESKTAFDLGHAVHTQVLGEGSDVVVLDFPDYRSKAAQQAAKDARDDGRTPLLTDQWEQVFRATNAILGHPVVFSILESGKPEAPMQWTAPDGTPMRGMFDWWSEERGIILDLKTAADATPSGFARAAANFHYPIQAAAYVEAAAAYGVRDAAFIWAVVELKPPYLAAVYEPTDETLETGRAELADARRIWRECTDTGEWPGLTTDIQPLDLPRWAQRTEYVA